MKQKYEKIKTHTYQKQCKRQGNWGKVLTYVNRVPKGKEKDSKRETMLQDNG